LAAWLFFTIMTTFSRFASQTVPMTTIVFFQNFISWIFLIPWILKHGIGALRTERIGLIFFRAALGVFGNAFVFMAAHRISLVDAIMLNNTAPLLLPFVTLMNVSRLSFHNLNIFCVQKKISAKCKKPSQYFGSLSHLTATLRNFL
jgi:drug/metabolite transporter (DMT)-like permease